MEIDIKKGDTVVFLSPIPQNVSCTELYPHERSCEVFKASNENVRREKYYAWRVLEYLLLKTRGISITEVSFKKSEGGRWSAEGFDFSISHSDSVVAVALSDFSVGVDIEPIVAPRSASFAKRILLEDELSEYSSLPDEKRTEYLTRKWTEKEALFKLRNISVFVPRNIRPSNGERIETEIINLCGTAYVASVATRDGDGEIRFFVINNILFD